MYLGQGLIQQKTAKNRVQPTQCNQDTKLMRISPCQAPVSTNRKAMIIPIIKLLKLAQATDQILEGAIIKNQDQANTPQ